MMCDCARMAATLCTGVPRARARLGSMAPHYGRCTSPRAASRSRVPENQRAAPTKKKAARRVINKMRIKTRCIGFWCVCECVYVLKVGIGTLSPMSNGIICSIVDTNEFERHIRKTCHPWRAHTRNEINNCAIVRRISVSIICSPFFLVYSICFEQNNRAIVFDSIFVYVFFFICKLLSIMFGVSVAEMPCELCRKDP